MFQMLGPRWQKDLVAMNILTKFSSVVIEGTFTIVRAFQRQLFQIAAVRRIHAAPYWSNPPFLIFDITALWRSVLSARVPECQKLKMMG